MNTFYARYRDHLLAADTPWTGLPVGLVAWSGIYFFDEAHITVANVQTAGGTVVSVAEPNPTTIAGPGGYAITDAMLLKAVPVGPPVSFLTLIRVGPSVPTSELIAYINQAEGLPFIPNGLDIVVQPDWLNRRGWFRP